MKRIGTLAGLAILTPLAIEAAARIARVSDVPLYDTDGTIGYIPRPNQSGAFLWTKDFAFNALSMGTARAFRPDARHDVLLVGDSIVAGGNGVRQRDRLGPQLERLTGWSVWPISSGSWALQNQLIYLEMHPRVVAAVDDIVFVLNSEDFDVPGMWQSEITHPRTRPFSASLRVLNKLLPGKLEPSPMPVRRSRDLIGDFAKFVASSRKEVTVIYYPKRDELGPRACKLHPVGFEKVEGVRWRCVPQVGSWPHSMYRDTIHPTNEGTRRLAAIIAGTVRAPSDSTQR